MSDQAATPSNSNASVDTASEALTAEVETAWQTVANMVDGFVALLPKLVVAAVVFALFMLGAWIVKLFVQRMTVKHPSAHIGRVMGRLGQWAVLIAGVMVAVAIVAPSVTPAKLLGALGIGSVAIGFAFKDVLQNFLAGILILLRQPFRVGDAVEFDDHEGVIEDIDTRLTIIKTYDGKQVLIPNGEIYTNPITVVTAYDKRRTQYDVGIGYGDDIGVACESILQAMRNTEGVLSDPQPDVIVNELAGSSVNIRARWWSKTDEVLGAKSRVMRAIKEALDEAQVDMPYPTQVHLLHDQTETTDGDRKRQREGWPAGEHPPGARAEQQHSNGRSRDFARSE